MSDADLPEHLTDFFQKMVTKLALDKPFPVETIVPPDFTKYNFGIGQMNAILNQRVEEAETIFRECLPYHKRRVKLAYEAEQITEKYLHAFTALLLEMLIVPNPVLRHHMIKEYWADRYPLYSTVKELVADNSEHVQAWTKKAIDLVGDVTQDHPAIVNMKTQLLCNIQKGMCQMEHKVAREMYMEEEAADDEALKSQFSM